MKDQYVILTGSKNNAGDFLIKYRAKLLLSKLKPNRTIVDMDGWKPFSSEQLEEINQSRALLMTGGPAIQRHMGSRIYPMVEDLTKIKVPLILMGVGYRGKNGTMQETASYPLDDRSMEVLRKADSSGFTSSVRDYHTLNTLFHKEIKNVVMTGCPALYELDHIGGEFKRPEKIESIAFSLGASYQRSKNMFNMMQKVIEGVQSRFSTSKVKVYLHNKIARSISKQSKMLVWFDRMGIEYEDISGSEQRLIEVYSNADLHIGYRVHAHIFVSSISRPSVLLAEDGRGAALESVISGLIFRGFEYYKGFAHHEANYENPVFLRALNKFNLIDNFSVNPHLVEDLLKNLEYEISNNFPRMAQTRMHIDRHYEIMKAFIKQLP